MQVQSVTFKNVNYIIRPITTPEQVVIFQVLKSIPLPNRLELTVMYGWVDRKLVELSPRNNENSELLDAFKKEIIAFYRLN